MLAALEAVLQLHTDVNRDKVQRRFTSSEFLHNNMVGCAVATLTFSGQ